MRLSRRTLNTVLSTQTLLLDAPGFILLAGTLDDVAVGLLTDCLKAVGLTTVGLTAVGLAAVGFAGLDGTFLLSFSFSADFFLSFSSSFNFNSSSSIVTAVNKNK